MRLDKYLADCGAGSRSEIKKMIRGGLVRVEGLAQPRPETQLEPDTARVWVNGEMLVYRKFVYLMLHKPAGYLSATWDSRQPTVMDLVPERYLHYRIFPMGRLDIDTEGLCILTNDGQLAHRLLSPRSHVPKTYLARVEGQVNREDVRKFRQGLVLDEDFHTLPAQLEILEAGPVSRVRVTIMEGKFHQIKRMFHAVGKEVLYLKRLRIGGLDLDESLAPGECRELTEQELELLQKE